MFNRQSIGKEIRSYLDIFTKWMKIEVSREEVEHKLYSEGEQKKDEGNVDQ